MKTLSCSLSSSSSTCNLLENGNTSMYQPNNLSTSFSNLTNSTMIDDSLTYSTSVLPHTSMFDHAPDSAMKTRNATSIKVQSINNYQSISLEVEKLMSKGYTREQAIAIVQNRTATVLQATNMVRDHSYCMNKFNFIHIYRE
jgi:hypothetical protein